ncbi:MAG TPA: hypothetical protein ENH82_00295 [bacterium]|nr:hypothetical protein [bacterium]
MSWLQILNGVLGFAVIGFFIYRIWQGYEMLQITPDKNQRHVIITTMLMRGLLAFVLIFVYALVIVSIL